MAAIWIGGPPNGLLRVEVSKNPRDRFNLMVQHCISGPEARYVLEAWVDNIDNAQRVLDRFKDHADKIGFFHPPDRYGVQPDRAVAMLRDCAAACGVALMTPEDMRHARRGWVEQRIEDSLPERLRKDKGASSRVFRPRSW